MRRAEANGVGGRLSAVAADGACLPFSNGSLDLIHGCGVLHHMEDIDKAAREIRRVLRPGGRAVFIEPLGHNPFLELARRRFGYRGKCRAPGEKPLQYEDLEPLRRVFPDLRTHERKLLGMLDRVTDVQPLTTFLDTLDRGLLALIPPLRRWCRLVVIECPV
jgi:ubiquinone/menaquinone biosynthesis C-methylase UbiE